MFLNKNIWISLIRNLGNDPISEKKKKEWEIGIAKQNIKVSISTVRVYGPALLWASYQIHKIAGRACAGNAGNVFPATDFKGNHELAILACITARAWPLSAKQLMR